MTTERKLSSKQFSLGSRGPLSGIRVLDMSRLMAGNMLSLHLADFGAEVVKVEPPTVGDTLRHWRESGHSVWWKVYARNKKSITLNSRNPEGVELLRKLLPGTQVLIESFRPGVLESIGLGPDELFKLNPKLVLVRISGWGQSGPYRLRPGFGTLIEGMSGFAAKNGFADKPPALPNLGLADMVAGLSAWGATLIALREAEREGGVGQVVDVSLLEPLLSILGPDVALQRISGKVQPRMGNRTSITAPRNAYETRDGEWVVLSGSTQGMTERIFSAIGRSDLKSDPRFATSADRIKNVEALDDIIGGFIGERDLEENLEHFERHSVTVGPICNALQLSHNEHVQQREVIVELPDDDLGSIAMHNVTPRLSETPGSIRSPAPSVGEHNEAVYGALGLSQEALRSLKEKGAI